MRAYFASVRQVADLSLKGSQRIAMLILWITALILWITALILWIAALILWIASLMRCNPVLIL